MTRNANQAAYYRGQRAFHSGANNQHGCLLQSRVLGQQAMQPGNANIGHQIDMVAHQLGGNSRLFGYRQIAGAGAYDSDLPLSNQRILEVKRDAAARLDDRPLAARLSPPPQTARRWPAWLKHSLRSRRG
jgi:hypothetical protein